MLAITEENIAESNIKYVIVLVIKYTMVANTPKKRYFIVSESRILFIRVLKRCNFINIILS